MPADPLVDRDVLLGDFGRAPVGRRGTLRRRQRPKQSLHLIERPFQVDRCRPRRQQHGIGAIERGIGSISPHGERHAVSGGGADQRRAAHQHGTDRLGRVLGARDARHHEFMRQPPLVDRADRPAVFLEPDAAEMPAVDLHESQHPARHRIELGKQVRIARFRRRDQCSVERLVRSDRARLMLARKIPGETCNERLGLAGIRVQHANDVLHGDGVVIGMPAIEIGDHRHAGVAVSASPASLAPGMLVMPITEEPCAL